MTAAIAAIAVLGIAFVPSSAQAEPDIDEVRTQVQELYRQAEQASERRNEAEAELERLRSELSVLEADEATQSDGFETVRAQVADSIVAQSQGGSVSPVAEAALTNDIGAFLSQLSTQSVYDGIQGQLVDTYTAELASLQIRRDATQARVDEIAAIEAQAQADSDEIDEQVEAAEAILADLEAEQQAAVFAEAGTTNDPADAAAAAEGATEQTAAANVPVSGRAAAAVEHALAQVGDSYVYGARGPDSFDCSGLTGAAWAAAGVSLPRSSKAQYSGAGAQVSRSELQPGDLVFYYSPISHVGIYIGNGQIVHAANPRTGVAIAGVGSMPYSGAVRPG